MTSTTDALPKVIVVGGGIVGLNTAYELASRGANVIVLEAGGIAQGTTSTSYAWLNSNNKEPDSYFELNEAGLRAHQRMAGTAAPWMAAEGHVEVASDIAHDDELVRRAGRLAERGYQVEEISGRTAARLIPSLKIPSGTRRVVHFPDEGALYPLLYVAELVRRLRSLGAEIRENTPVTGVAGTSDGGARLTLDSGEALFADRVVLAAGRHSAGLAHMAGVDLPLLPFREPGDLTVGYLLRTNPLPIPLTQLITTDWINIRPDGGGRLLLQTLDLDASADPRNVPGEASELAREVLHRLQAVFSETAGAVIDQVLVGQRPMPADGRSLIGVPEEAEWLYVLVTHSGVTLAPALAEGAAAEVTGGREPMFDKFRLSRFAAGPFQEKPLRPRKPGEQ